MPYVETVMLIVHLAQDEIISNLVLPDVIDQDDPSWTSLELDFF